MSQSLGFTLMEIVLAIALMSVVMYLLTTAIEMFMIRIESSRGRVESAQVARTLLDRMAADLSAARLYAPPSSKSSSSSSSGGGASGGAAGGSGQASGSTPGSAAGASGTTPPASGATGGAAAAGAADDLLSQSDVQGIYGTLDQVRIDRTAAANWERASRQVESGEGTSRADLPATVRYYVVDGDRLTSQALAQRGVPEDDRRSTSAGGLYRATRPTASLGEGDDALGETADADEDARLLAPEVVKLELHYFDGTTLTDSWDAYDAGGLPAGVEIRLTLYEPRIEDDAEETADRVASGRLRENELVEYRRFVRIPSISPQQPAEALLPAGSGGQNGSGSGAQGGNASGTGQGGTGQSGGNQGGGQGSGQN
jgi:type II secretory pathway pseudopilin PulG